MPNRPSRQRSARSPSLWPVRGAWLLALLLMAPASAHAQGSPLSAVDAALTYRLPFGMPIHLSADGRRVAYTVTDPRRAHRPAGEGSRQVFSATGVHTEAAGAGVRVTDLATGETVAVMPEDVNAWAPVWSPDGARLAFYSDATGEAGLWVWEPDSRETRRISGAVVRPGWNWETPRWTPDGRHVAVKILPAGTTLAEANRRAAQSGEWSDPAPDGATVRVFGRDPIGGSGAGIGTAADTIPGELPPAYRWMYSGDLALVNVASGAVRRLVTGVVPHWWEVSPDGDRMAFTHAVGTDPRDDEHIITALAVVSVRGGEPVELASSIDQPWGVAVTWSPDGRKLAWVTPGAGENAGVFVARVESGEVARVADPRPGWAHPYQGPLWGPDSNALYFTAGEALWRVPLDGGAPLPAVTLHGWSVDAVLARAGAVVSPDPGNVVLRAHDRARGVWSFFRAEPATGRYQALSEDVGSYYGHFYNDISADGTTVVLQYANAAQPPDLWLAGPELRRHRRISHLNPQFDSYAFGTTRLVEWTAQEDRVLRGTLLLPPNYTEGDRLPMIVVVYGGTMGSGQLHNFDPTRQLFATRGYAVLVPDAPVGLGSPMHDLAAAVLPGIDAVVELGIADPDRVGVFGHSYGGYGVLALLVQTDRFRAAVASASHGNLFGMHSQVDATGGLFMTRVVEQGQGRMGGSPWELRERYIENSPFFFLDRVTTPLLLLHGAGDRNTPVHLAEQIYVGLKRLERPVVYARYEDEGHWWGMFRAPNRIDYWQRVVDWFDGHLRSDLAP